MNRLTPLRWAPPSGENHSPDNANTSAPSAPRRLAADGGEPVTRADPAQRCRQRSVQPGSNLPATEKRAGVPYCSCQAFDPTRLVKRGVQPRQRYAGRVQKSLAEIGPRDPANPQLSGP